jgi:hypothetical protein
MIPDDPADVAGFEKSVTGQLLPELGRDALFD